MRRRERILVLLFVSSMAGCGRIGYEQLARADRRDTGGVTGTADAGSSGGTTAGGSGGMTAGGGSNGSDAARDGGSSAGGASGAADAGDGAPATDGASGAGGGTARGGAGGGGGATEGGVATSGCADGEREGFLDLGMYPDVAACAGGFALPGVIGLTGPACGRAGGDDGPLPDGTGCNASDLCAVGFHLCRDDVDFGAKSSAGCADAAAGIAGVFYATAQPGPGQAKCGTTGTDDVFGCGSMGARPNLDCAPLTAWSGNLCTQLITPWSCGPDQTTEALTVVKPGSESGGVLCCRD